jgi:hypothetical protein
VFVECESLEVKVPPVCLVTEGVSPPRDGHYITAVLFSTYSSEEVILQCVLRCEITAVITAYTLLATLAGARVPNLTPLLMSAFVKHQRNGYLT